MALRNAIGFVRRYITANVLTATDKVVGAVELPTYSVAGAGDVPVAPDVALNEGKIIYVTDGDAGAPCLARSDGTDWLRIGFGAAIAVV